MKAPSGRPASHQPVEGGGALRHVGSVLEKQRVAGGELRRQDASDLIVRKIPRLDGKQHAERLIDEHRLALGRIENRQLLGLEQPLGVADVIFEDLRRELDLGLRLGEELAHFQRQELGVVVGITPQDSGGLLQDAPALGKGSLPPRQKGVMSLAYGCGHFRIRSVWKGLELLARIGVDSCVGHFRSPSVECVCWTFAEQADFQAARSVTARSFTAWTIWVSTACASP